MNGVTSVILGGGRGTRLFPLTLERAKPAVGFAGKYRLIDIPISNCINSHIRRVFVLTQFLSASLHRHIMQSYQFDTFSDGFIDILAAEQTPKSSDWFQGTADAVRATLHHITYYNPDQIVILSGDHLYRMNYAELVQFHRDTKADITLCVYPVTREEASRFGLLKVNDAGEVLEFAEKPKDPAVLDLYHAPEHIFSSKGKLIKRNEDLYLASMGIYVFNTGVLTEVLKNKAHTDFGGDIIPAAIGNCRMLAYPFTDYWQDIGTIGSLFEANIALAQPNPPFSLYKPLWPIYTRQRSLPPSRIIRSVIRDSLIIEGSDINGARITDSVIGVRSIIREETRINDVVMFGADFYEGEQILFGGEPATDDQTPLGIGRGCIIERAMIDKNARIGDDVVIRAKPNGADYEGDNHWIRDGITIIPKGAVIPSGTII